MMCAYTARETGGPMMCTYTARETGGCRPMKVEEVGYYPSSSPVLALIRTAIQHRCHLLHSTLLGMSRLCVDAT